MSEPNPSNNFRSPLLMDRVKSLLVVVDVQEKLLPLIRNSERVEWNIGRLVDAAITMKVPAVATEQYPKGLGHTVDSLQAKLAQSSSISIPEKTLFSCRECQEILDLAKTEKRHQIILTGIETHVCVMQTALDYVAAGFDVFVVADAVGSRSKLDYRIALQRMQTVGVNVVTAESVMFEWCEVSGTPEFKQMSQLVKQTPPEPRQSMRSG